MITWSDEVIGLIKNDKSPLPRGPCLPNLTRWRFIVTGHHPLSLLTPWSRDQVITWQMKNVIFQLPWDLWLPHLTELWVLMRGYYPSSHSTCWPRGHRRSHDKWKMFWIHFHVTCCYQTWQKGGLWLGVKCPTTKPHIHSITWQINFVISLLSRGLTGWWLVMRSHHS